ncbi:MAG: class I SAM-dependent methyltransferase [Candidatus Acidiferrales bacterium]
MSTKRHSEVTAGAIGGINLLDCERRYSGEGLYYERHFSLIDEECRSAYSFLDVGCGTGRLLELLSARTEMRRLGIELNAQAAQFARRVANCEILEIPFEEFRTSVRFDVISLINVFSHIPSLDGLFASLRATLAPGGKAILRTSEMSTGVSRWNQLHWGIPDDLHFLGLNTIAFLCRKYGFEVRRRVRVPYEEELFLRSRWQQMGRRRLVNIAKQTAIRLPGALAAMKSLYRAGLGNRLFVSFIVLSPIAASNADAPIETE